MVSEILGQNLIIAVSFLGEWAEARETTMNIYSPERKAAVLARMLPPHNLSINEIARQKGIPAKTPYGWRSQAAY